MRRHLHFVRQARHKKSVYDKSLEEVLGYFANKAKLKKKEKRYDK